MVVIYRKNSDHARPVYEFLEIMSRRYPDKKIVEMDTETREGAAEATLYGVMQYPAIIASANDGSVQGMWEGVPLPLIDEVASMLLEQQPTTV